ncbi:MAG: hypothetical protein HYS44_01030 [Candidatus Niyogibacteria bacterium]|nr:hypothetical protein [Candidatus Niyogibacteria bacterium]
MMRFRVEVSCPTGGEDIDHGYLDVIVNGIEDSDEGEATAQSMASTLGYRYQCASSYEGYAENRFTRRVQAGEDDFRVVEKPTAEVVGGEGDVLMGAPKGTVIAW